MFGHWFNEHRQDGSLPDGTVSNPSPVTYETKPATNAANDERHHMNQKIHLTITFKTATTIAHCTGQCDSVVADDNI